MKKFMVEITISQKEMEVSDAGVCKVIDSQHLHFSQIIGHSVIDKLNRIKEVLKEDNSNGKN